MSIPPPLTKTKKNKVWIVILIVVAAIVILCVAITILTSYWAKTPKGSASLTQGAADRTNTALFVTFEPTNTPNLKIKNPTKTPIPSKTAIPTKTSTSTITPTATKELSGISFQDIVNTKENSTDAQWDEYKKQIRNKRVIWSGIVDDVSKNGAAYLVYACIDNPCANRFYFRVSDQSIALNINKGDQINIDGEIDTDLIDFMDLFGMDIGLNKAVILP